MCGRTIFSFHFNSIFWSAWTLFCIPKRLKFPCCSCIKADLKMYVMLIDIPISSLIKYSRVYEYAFMYLFIFHSEVNLLDRGLPLHRWHFRVCALEAYSGPLILDRVWLPINLWCHTYAYRHSSSNLIFVKWIHTNFTFVVVIVKKKALGWQTCMTCPCIILHSEAQTSNWSNTKKSSFN